MIYNFNDLFTSVEELEHNLAIFEKTLRENSNLANDKVFLVFKDIFNSVHNCNEPLKSKEIISLTSRISKLDDLVDDCNYFNFRPDLPSELLGGSRELASLADEFEGICNVEQGLRLIDEKYTYRSIAGDGHCLFRATGTSLLHFAKNNPEKAKEIVTKLKLQPKFSRQAEVLEELFRKLETSYSIFASIKYLAKQTIVPQFLGGMEIADPIAPEVENIMRDENASDSLVQALRELAVNYLENEVTQHPDGNIALIILGESDSSIDTQTYFASMKDMSNAKYGGNPELFALEMVLDLALNVLDSDASGKVGKIIETPANDGRDTKLGQLHIIRRGMHYDLAVERPQHSSQEIYVPNY